MAFDLAKCDSVSKSKDEEISGYKNAIKHDSTLLSIKDQEIDLRDNRLKEKDVDISFYQKEAKKERKRVFLWKGLTLLTGLVGSVGALWFMVH